MNVFRHDARAQRARPGGRAQGFTIVEVVVAMGVFLIGMSSILGLLAFGATLTRTAALRNDAAAAVEAVMADLEESLFPLVEQGSELVAGEPQVITDRPLRGRGDILYSAQPIPNPDGVSHPGETLEYKVEVVLAWTSGGQRRSRAFTSILLREVPFGERLRRQFVSSSSP